MVQALRLDWCKAIPYGGGKLGGWVLENYLGAACLMSWFYAPLDEIALGPVCVAPE